MPTPSIRVASVPSSHWYVRNIADPDGDDIVRLPDANADPSAFAGWWPPAMLDPEWVAEHSAEFDLLHVHFGFDGRTPSELEELCARLRFERKPLVYTVHDLRNPHHADPGPHLAQMDVLVRHADELLTLTPAAAAEVHRRWGRRPRVVPHPHIVPLEMLGGTEPRPMTGRAVVGIHLKSLRTNMFGVDLVESLARRLLPESGRIRVRVDIHPEVREGPRGAEALDSLERLAGSDAIDLRVHDYFSDAGFYAYVEEIDVAVLPYRFGTHSGWLEACRDVGTAVVAPSIGCYSSQGETFAFDPALAGEALSRSVANAVARAALARSRGRIRPLGARSRLEQRRGIARAHRSVYTRALERAAAGAAA